MLMGRHSRQYRCPFDVRHKRRIIQRPDILDLLLSFVQQDTDSSKAVLTLGCGCRTMLQGAAPEWLTLAYK